MIQYCTVWATISVQTGYAPPPHQRAYPVGIKGHLIGI
jgi:hypothetical protein